MKLVLGAVLVILGITAKAQDYYLLTGSYTSGKSEGIYVYTFDTKDASAVLKSSMRAANPSFLAVAPDEHHVYAVYEEGNNKIGGTVAAYSFDKTTGQLHYINQRLSGGDHPCYVAVDKTGHWVTAANYTGGSAAVLPINADGSLDSVHQIIQHSGSSVNKERQEKAHVHCTFFSADNKYVYTPDLGMDKVMIYAFDEKRGLLSPAGQPFVKTVPGSGPRHICFTPDNKHAYLMQELTGMVAVYTVKNGALSNIQNISAAQPGFRGFMGSADIHTSPDGKFLYCSNRGDANTITIFRINPANGKLTIAGFQSTMGKGPRNFSLDPSGNFLLVANQLSDNIVIFRRNPKTGLLTDTGKRIETGNPVCLKWIPIR